MAWTRVITVIIFLSVFLAGCVFQNTHYAQFMDKPHHTLRIATYNLYWNNGTCPINHPKSTSGLIKRIDSDIILLQEVNLKLETCLQQILTKQYPYREFRFYGKEGGLAILSKYPFKTDQYILPDQGWYPAWLTTIKTPAGKLQVLNVHLRPQVLPGDKVGVFLKAIFTTPSIREKEIKQFYAYLNPNRPTIIAGDFNEEDHGRAVNFLRKRGFFDTLSRHSQYTWKYKIGPFYLAKRFDHIFLSPHLHLRKIQILHESTSDHFPVVVDLNVDHKGSNLDNRQLK